MQSMRSHSLIVFFLTFIIVGCSSTSGLQFDEELTYDVYLPLSQLSSSARFYLDENKEWPNSFVALKDYATNKEIDLTKGKLDSLKFGRETDSTLSVHFIAPFWSNEDKIDGKLTIFSTMIADSIIGKALFKQPTVNHFVGIPTDTLTIDFQIFDPEHVRKRKSN